MKNKKKAYLSENSLAANTDSEITQMQKIPNFSQALDYKKLSEDLEEKNTQLLNYLKDSCLEVNLIEHKCNLYGGIMKRLLNTVVRRKRRKNAELVKSEMCPYEGCDKVYASTNAVRIHMKRDHLRSEPFKKHHNLFKPKRKRQKKTKSLEHCLKHALEEVKEVKESDSLNDEIFFCDNNILGESDTEFNDLQNYMESHSIEKKCQSYKCKHEDIDYCEKFRMVEATTLPNSKDFESESSYNDNVLYTDTKMECEFDEFGELLPEFNFLDNGIVGQTTECSNHGENNSVFHEDDMELRKRDFSFDPHSC